MAIHWEDYRELLEDISAGVQELLAHTWPEASKILSARGLDNYVKGVSALSHLGKGEAVVLQWIRQAPLVAHEVGEDSLLLLLEVALSFASRISGSVIEQVISTAPTAANRLADQELFERYLQFLNQFIGQAPRGLRPMLEHLDELLGQLTLGGLRRWATWGAHAYRTDFAAQIDYFSLNSKESKAVLQQERKGTLFVDVQRRINMYLRALWARDFFMRPTSGDFEKRDGYKPYIEGFVFHLPDAFDDVGALSGLTLYRASAAHCAAHWVVTQAAISAEELNPLQMALIEIFEDARVESLAIKRFPGLRKIWSECHVATPELSVRTGDFLNRLARALLDLEYSDTDPWIQEAKQVFYANEARWDDAQLSWELGVTHVTGLMRKKLPYNPRQDIQTALYRDDNRFIWHYEEFDWNKQHGGLMSSQRPIRKNVSLMEMINEIDSELEDGSPQEIWVLNSELFPYEDNGVSYNEQEGREPISDPFHYDEWDYQIQLDRPAWTTVVERRPRRGELSVVSDMLTKHKRLINEMKFLLAAIQPQGVVRTRKLEEGDELDLNAVIGSWVDLRMGLTPDPRIMMRNVLMVRDISVLLLLDLSESTNEKLSGQEMTVLDLTREATVLLAGAISQVGDAFAVHGFCSDGREGVEYYRFKDFSQAYNDEPKQRIAGMTGQLSTRMGAAIRHAQHHLSHQKTSKKLLLILTDGEPADVDVRDPQYLRHDTKKAVEAARRQGILTYCISLDPRADLYVSRIFGARNYLVLDDVNRLPEKLPQLYAGLTR